jgi:hypothetical protein
LPGKANKKAAQQFAKGVMCHCSLKKVKRKFYDTQIILTTISKINQIQKNIQISS